MQKENLVNILPTNLEIVHLSILLSANRNIQNTIAIIIGHARENLYVIVVKE